MRAATSGRSYYAGVLEALTMIMGCAQGYLRHHGPRSAMLADRLGRELGMREASRGRLFFAALLSDMGMVGVAEDAWERPTPVLSTRVRERVRLHPLRSEEAVRRIRHLEGVAPLVRRHHEWWDGSGYPDGLSGADIDPEARVLRLADTVSALREPRPHRAALGTARVADVVRAGRGREFGHDEARAFLALDTRVGQGAYDPDHFREALTRMIAGCLPEEISPPSVKELLRILADLIDAKDPYTAGHSRRVAALAVAVAEQLGLPRSTRDVLWAAGYLHDLGKLRVPLRVLTKPGALSSEEVGWIRAHPVLGAELLGTIPTLRHLTHAVRYHHERWDGRGYPAGLAGDRIPLTAQILAVCDAYDAMISVRAYRHARAPDDAFEEIARSSGSHFNPVVAEAFFEVSEDTFAAVHADRPLSPRVVTDAQRRRTGVAFDGSTMLRL